MRGKPLCKMIILALLCQISLPSSAGPIIGVKEWFQPADVTGYTWNDFNDICSTGLCTGQIGGTGPLLTGYTWATVDDVNELLNSFIGSPVLSGPSSYNGPSTATWAAEFTAVFTPTQADGHLVRTQGFINDTAGSLDQFGRGGHMIHDLAPGHSQFAGTNSSFIKHERRPFMGAWLYRDAPLSVPTPATVTLFGLAIAGLGINRGKRSKNS